MMFEKFREERAGEVVEVETFLSRPLSDDPVVLRSQLARAVSHYSRVGVIQGWANDFLRLAKKDKLKPKEKGTTDFEREITLDSDTSSEQRYCEIMHSHCKSLEKFITSGQTLISSHKAEMLALGVSK